MTTQFACKDDFNDYIVSRHRTLTAALRAQHQRNRRLVAQGYSAIYGVVALVDGQETHLAQVVSESEYWDADTAASGKAGV